MAALASAALLCALVATASGRLVLDEVQLLQASVDAAYGAGALVADRRSKRGGPGLASSPCNVLLFFSVGPSPELKELVPRNVDHVRNTSGLVADVYLAHYDHNRSDWQRELGQWYDQNVNFSAELSGIKFWLAKDLLLASQNASQNESLPQVDIHSYEYLWILDEDAAFFQTDLARMFELARGSNASIMSPAFSVSDGTGDDESHFRSGARGRMVSDMNCQPGGSKCMFEAPHPECSVRYTNFVECSFTLMRPEAFEKVVGGCKECLPNRTTTWGLDMVWCHYAAEKEGSPKEKTCAILDGAPIIHANTKSHPKYVHGKFDWKEYHKQMSVLRAVKRKMKRYFASRLHTYGCEA